MEEKSNLDDLPTSKYIKNVIILTVLWTNSSFSLYTLNYMNKHYEANIFLTFYLEGIAGIVGTLLAAPLYYWLKIRWSFVFILAFANLFIILFFIH